MTAPPTSIPPDLRDALAGAYDLQRELGGGAMARVFVATERALGRQVVIKVLTSELSEALSPERFRREILLAARLQHPNIVPVLAAGDIAGVPYYTMPFVPGESLRHRLSAHGRLSPGELWSVLGDVAKALEYAHHEGVVHRDIKPENVLLHGRVPGSGGTGSAVVADFGIAKALQSAHRGADGGSGGGALTHLGMTLGTPAYMAPEQAVGEEVDHRADIYAFGVMAYELALGAPPFVESSTQRMMVAHLTREPVSLLERVPEIPAAFDALVLRCLAKEPADRPGSMGEVLRVLREMESASVMVASTAPPAALTRERPEPITGASVAVLPFVNLSADPEAEYFSDGVTEEVLNALARVPGLRVAARTSAFAFKGRQVPLESIAQQLKVRTLLEGSVRRSGNRVRIGVQLVSAADGLHLWSERYDRELSDVFVLQDEIAGSIAMALGERLTSGEKGVVGTPAAPMAAPQRQDARHGALNLQAYEQYLRGRFLFEQHDHRVIEALHCLETATSLDPDFALAHAWTGVVYSILAAYQLLPPAQAFERARAATDRALAISPELPEALTARATVALWYEWDLDASESLARRAVKLAPGLGIAHEWLGWAMLSAERFDDAEAAMSRALELDPLNTYSVVSLVFALNMGNRASRALELVRAAIERSPADAELHRLAGLALLTDDRYAEAAAELRRSRELNPANAFVAGNLASALALAGEREEARRIADEMIIGAEAGRVPAAMVALALNALGDRDDAFEWLGRALERREFWMSMVHVDSEFWRLRDDPRFDEIVRKVGVRR